MSKGVLVLTNIRKQYLPNRVEVKVKGLGWVDILNPHFQGYVIQSSIPNSKYISVMNWAARKGIFKVDKMGGVFLIKGG